MSLLTKPTREPISLEEAKRHLRVEHDDDDIFIERLIFAARQHCENITNLSLVRQQHRFYMSAFTEVIIPRGPVKEISQVQYIDSDGATQTLATTVYNLNTETNEFLLAYDQSWPTTRDQANAVWIDYWAGFFDNSISPVRLMDDLPEDIRAALLLIIGDLYVNRESASAMEMYENKALDMLLGGYRVILQ